MLPTPPRANSASLSKRYRRPLASKGIQGVLVTQVKPGSFADESGLTSGLVITEINRQPVTSMDQFQSLVSALEGRGRTWASGWSIRAIRPPVAPILEAHCHKDLPGGLVI